MDSTEDMHIAMVPYQKNNDIVSRIPPEIWREIFVHTLPYEQPHMYVRPKSSEAPLKLGLVCREWRHISTTCPDLWTSISIDLFEVARPWSENGPIDHQPRTDTEELCALYAKIGAGVEKWLSRSGCLPLTIYYQEGGTLLDPTTRSRVANDVRVVREIFISVASRWRHLKIAWLEGWLKDSGELVEVLLTGTRTPLLKSLSISPRGPLDLSRLNILSRLSFGISNIKPHNIHELILPPHLKHIDMTHGPLDVVLGVLQKSPSLVSAKLHTYKQTGGSVLPELVIHHLEKLSLEVTVLHRPVAERFWDSLTLPSLKTLELDWPSKDPPPSLAHCPSMLLRSRCDLEHLVFGAPPSSYDTMACLSACPNLQSLTFRYHLHDNNDKWSIAFVLDRLAEDNTTARPMMFTFCSKLHKLSLEVYYPERLYLEALINFLVSRCHAVDDGYPPSGEVLKEFEVSFKYDTSSFIDIWRQALKKNALLRKCITGGLCVKIILGYRKYLFGPNFPQGVQL